MKKLLSYINIFELDLNSRSYKSGLIRIAVSLLVMAAVCVFRFNVTIQTPWINLSLSALLIIIIVLAILCLFNATVECLQVGDNRKKDKNR